jgi:hypothetical protein
MLRAAAVGRRLFQHGGIQVHEKWTELDASKAEVRTFLVRFVPRWVRLHPSDQPKLGEFGLVLDGATIVDTRAPKPVAPASSAPAAGPPPAKGGAARK